jgi:iron complex transport system ATP-binding protein
MTLLEIDNVTAGYRGRVALRGVSLRARGGEVLAVLGPNGAGKTTLLRAIDQTIRAAAGAVRLDGEDLARMSALEVARRVAVVPQGLAIPAGFAVAEVVLMGRNPHLPPFGHERPRDHEAASAAMARTEVLTLADRPASELSGGEQQRVLIARALAQEPRVLLLDEATAHLDPRHQQAMMRLARRLAGEGLAVIATLHDINLAARYADRIVLLRDGVLLAEGAPAQVLTPALLRDAYDVPALVIAHPRNGTPLVTLLDEEDENERERERDAG